MLAALGGAWQTRQVQIPRLIVNGVPLARAKQFVVVLPGGGYDHLSEREAAPVTDWLGANGIAAGHFSYTVRAPYPQPLDEVLTVLSAVRAELPDASVGVLGFSAGGHLAGLAATATAEELARTGASRPDFAVLCYPMVSLLEDPHAPTRELLTGGHAEMRASLSLENRVDHRTGPVFLWHTAADQLLPLSHALRLLTALSDAGCEVEAHLYPHGEHGLALLRDDWIPESLGASVRTWMPLALSWLGRHVERR